MGRDALEGGGGGGGVGFMQKRLLAVGKAVVGQMLAVTKTVGGHLEAVKGSWNGTDQHGRGCLRSAGS